jgi:MoaA/NifB/PqqE/SkfB family radical SAM enzyme
VNSEPGWIVVWRVTEHCNLSCNFCRYDREQRFARKSADPALVLALGERIARHSRATGRAVHVSFLGGEPFAWPPLLEVARVFRRSFDLSVGITTNGTALSSAEVRSRVVDDLDQLTVSIDGLAPRFDALRGWRGGHATLSASLAAITELKRQRGRGPLLRVNTVLMRETFDDFLPSCRQLAALGVEEVTFNQLGGRDRPELFPTRRLTADHVARLRNELPAWRRELATLGLALRGGERYLARLAASAEGLALPGTGCDPGATFWFVDEDGRAAPCSFTTDAYGVPLETLDLGQVSGQLGALRRRAPHAACADCPSTHVFSKFSD